MAPDDPDDPVASASDEPRGKDLVTHTREQMAERLDAATLAELSSWFARPSTESVLEAALVEEEDAEVKRLNESRANAAAAVTPAMFRYVTRHERAAERIVPQRPEVKLHHDERILRDFIRQVLDRLHDEESSDERFFQQPEDVRNALDQNAPQAILRDLHRPVEEWSLQLQPMFEPQRVDESESIDALMREHYRMPEVPLSTTALREARAALRLYITLDWGVEVAAAAQARKDSLKGLPG